MMMNPNMGFHDHRHERYELQEQPSDAGSFPERMRNVLDHDDAPLQLVPGAVVEMVVVQQLYLIDLTNTALPRLTHWPTTVSQVGGLQRQHRSIAVAPQNPRGTSKRQFLLRKHG